MAVKIRLKRMGKIRAPFYRVVVMDSRTKRDGRAIEEIGKYHPTEEPSVIDIDMERADYWLANGAQPTEAVAALLKILKDGTLKVADAKTPKKDLYEAALASSGKEEEDHKAITAKKKADKEAADKKAADEAAAAKAAEEKAAAETAADETAPAADTEGSDAANETATSDADAPAESTEA